MIHQEIRFAVRSLVDKPGYGRFDIKKGMYYRKGDGGNGFSRGWYASPFDGSLLTEPELVHVKKMYLHLSPGEYEIVELDLTATQLPI